MRDDALRASLERLRQWAQLKNMCQCESCSQRRNDLRAALEAIEQDGWVSVKERLPRVGEYVHLLIHGVVQRMPARIELLGFAGEDGKVWDWLDGTADSCPIELPSHWFALPTPPSQEDGPQ